MKIGLLAGGAVLLALTAGCGGDGGSEDVGHLAAQLGCPHAKVSSRPQGLEPPRGDRAECHGLTVVTFADNSARDSYVHTVEKMNKAFNQPFTATVGDGWAVMGSPTAVDRAKQKLG